MKMNIIKHIATAAIPAALLLTSLTAAAQNYPEGSYRVVGGIGFNKHVTDNHDGTFTVDLESFVTGKVQTETQKVPADIIVLMDISASMDDAVGTDDYAERTKPVTLKATKAFSSVSKPVTEAGTRTMSPTSKTMNVSTTTEWSYNSIADPGATAFATYYKQGDNYYRVFREGSTAAGRRLYIMIGNTRWELFGTGIHEAGTPNPNQPTTAAGIIYTGPLYTGGWKPYNITEGTANGGHYYLYDGEYYPVRKEAAAQNYQPFVELPGLGKQYLTINGLSGTIPTDNVGNYTTQYVGDLYTASPSGGWKYSDFTVGETNANTTLLYKHTDDKYYPVIKKTEGGIRQAYVVVPEGTRYLNPSGKLTETPYQNATTDNVVLYSGTLYKGGWRSYDITLGTANNGHYYKHTDNEYYPVVKETVNGTHQAYVNLPEGKRYLAGYSVSPDPYPTTAGTTTANGEYSSIYFNELYTGGWKYSDFTVGETNANTTLLYKHTDDKYYPVIKKTEGGIRQAYVVVPEGTRYLNPSGKLTETPYQNATTDNVVLFTGDLYTGGWRQNDITAGSASGGHYYKHTDNEYYPVVKETVNGTHQAYVNLPEGKRYLAGYSVSPDPYPTTAGTTTANGEYSSIYFGSLYLHNVGYEKEEGLRRAMRAFIDALAEKSEEDDLHHRVALVEFNAAQTGTGVNYNNPKLTASSPIDNSASHVVVDFTEMWDAANVQTLKDAFPDENIDLGLGSMYAWGYAIARGLINREASAGAIENYDKRPKIVITIGDFEVGDITAARTQATNLDGMDNTTLVSVQVRRGTSTAYDGYAKELASKQEYYYKVNDFDESLIETLMNISEDIGGAELEVEGTVVTVDVVSKAFDIPKGEDVSKPTVLVANLTGKAEGTSWDPAPLTTGVEGDFVFYTFGTPVEQDVTVDPRTGETPSGIKLVETTDAEGNEKLEVTGFDYSAHWCGPDNKTSSGYHQAGQKLILRFTVVPNEAAVGGPEVQTNEEESGIWVSDPDDPDTKIKIATFNQPSVSLPVNLWIEKQGLEGDDSAVFTIYYADPSAAGNAGKSPHEMTYQSFTKVIVHASDLVDGKAMVKITGLDSKFYYKIKEDAWAWSYDYKTGEMYSSDVIQNPIQFVNETKTETVKHAESVVTNVFSTNE